MIRAGRIDEVSPTSGTWVFLDIGFANKAKSCGLLLGEGKPQEVTFNDAILSICDFINKSNAPVNLVIEAPLSVTFDIHGNPKGRSIEKQDKKTRYWYVSLGTTVMVAAIYLVKAIYDSKPNNEVRLFEGFVSFKDSSAKSNHSNDVLILRDIVNNSHVDTKAIVSPDDLRKDTTDKIQSAFLVAGLDFGIPPILLQNG